MYTPAASFVGAAYGIIMIAIFVAGVVALLEFGAWLWDGYRSAEGLACRLLDQACACAGRAAGRWVRRLTT